MRTFHSEGHRLHAPAAEFSGARWVEPYERPARVASVLGRLAERGFAAPLDPGPADLAAVEAVHDADYLAFLRSAHAEWRAAGRGGDMVPAGAPVRGMRPDRPPRSIDGRLGYHALGADTAITAGTWEAAISSAASAQAAQCAVTGGERAAFALCRPPGHHATTDQFGGYCFINNAAVAAQMFAAEGARVAVLDVDFHHGNGTQSIFWERGDVLTVSLHGDPLDCYPFFSGHADETGAGGGAGANVNLPMPPGTDWDRWSEALSVGLERIRAHGAEALVVALGVDAFEGDPISAFRLTSDDFTRAGAAIAELGLPSVFTMEGGYAIDEIGVNAVNTLEGFLGNGPRIGAP